MSEPNVPVPGQPKVAAGGLSGAIAVVLVWGLGEVGVEMPGAVASGVTMIIMTLAGYLKRG